MAYQLIEVLTGTERRRSYTPSQKVRMVDEAFPSVPMNVRHRPP
jgi:transposase